MLNDLFLHNGGGVGISKSINDLFGMVLDGSQRVDDILRTSMPWLPTTKLFLTASLIHIQLSLS